MNRFADDLGRPLDDSLDESAAQGIIGRATAGRGVLAHEYYRPCDPTSVPAVTRLATEIMRRIVRTDLRLRQLRLEWFGASDRPLPTEEWGDPVLSLLNRGVDARHQIHGRVSLMTPQVVWIRADLSPYMAAMTVAEEARHVWQLRQTTWKSHPGSWADHRRMVREMEADARAYMRQHAAMAKGIAAQARAARMEQARER
jgi:hypothetical protein